MKYINPLKIALLLGILTVGITACKTGIKSPLKEKAVVRLSESLVGFESNTFDSTDSLVKAAVLPKGNIQAAVLSISRNGIVVFEKAYGTDGNGNKVQRDALFDMASLTKPLVTASSVALLVCRGEIDLNQTVAGYTVEQCLQHQTRLPVTIDWKLLNDQDLNVALLEERLLGVEQQQTVGYSNSAYVLLGSLVESKTKESLEVFARNELFRPLNMTSTSFLPNTEGIYLLPASEGPKLLPTIGTIMPSAKDQELGRPYDPLADFMILSLKKAPGHSGVFSTARDVSLFAQGLMSPPNEEIACVAAILLQKGTGNRTNGFAVREDGSLEHTGFTGCLIWLDPKSKTSVALLTNQTLSHAETEWAELTERLIKEVSSRIEQTE